MHLNLTIIWTAYYFRDYRAEYERSGSSSKAWYISARLTLLNSYVACSQSLVCDFLASVAIDHRQQCRNFSYSRVHCRLSKEYLEFVASGEAPMYSNDSATS